MTTQELCHHIGCGRKSHTGFWCQDCIEREWPYASLGDGEHWIVWKGVDKIRANLFQGALECPYRLGQVIIPSGASNWLLSPLGAIKEGYGNHILAAIVRAQDCYLDKHLVLDCTSPVLPLAAFPRSQLPSYEEAVALLEDVNANLIQIEAFERYMRAQLQLPIPPLQMIRLFFERLLKEVPNYSHEQKAQIASLLLDDSQRFEIKTCWRLAALILGNDLTAKVRWARQQLEEQHYVEQGPWLLSRSGILYRAVPREQPIVEYYEDVRSGRLLRVERGELEAFTCFKPSPLAQRLVMFYLVVEFAQHCLAFLERESGISYEFVAEREPTPVLFALERKTLQSVRPMPMIPLHYAWERRLKKEIAQGRWLEV
jgi:hypothetical protein